MSVTCGSDAGIEAPPGELSRADRVLNVGTGAILEYQGHYWALQCVAVDLDTETHIGWVAVTQ